MKVCLLLVLCFISMAMSAVMETRTIGVEQIVKIRCSLNVEDETFYFFNGTVIGYLTNPTLRGNPILFNTIGINVGRCFKVAEGLYTLASREILYYLNPTTNEIIDRWDNPFTGETNITVAHVDNDPVLQSFNLTTANLQIYEDKAFLNLDIPLVYPNPLRANVTLFAPYSPNIYYQAGEFFKFIFPVANLDQDVNTVDYSLVSWTRQGPWLPWMKMGNISGHLIYSSAGDRIPSWEYLPPGVKADLDTRIPHYKHAPTCLPNTTSVTSWNFFLNHFQEYLDGAKFPLATPAQYGCRSGTEIPNPPTPTTPPTSTPTPTPNPLCPRNDENSASFKIGASFTTIITMFLVAAFL